MRSASDARRQEKRPGRGRKKRFAAAAIALSLALLDALLVWLFGRVLKAEGPISLLLAWTASSSCILFLYFAAPNTARQNSAKRQIRRAVHTALLLIPAAGALTVLLQVHIARRSLAEAWLDLARRGQAFGFFSFFAAELYALFLLGPAILLARKRFAAAAFAFLLIHGLCAGLILGSPLLLFFSLILTIGLLASLQSEKSAERSFLAGVKRRLLQTAAPLGATLAVAVLAAAGGLARSDLLKIPAPDLAPLILKIAPSFPLVRDIPGYGFTVGEGSLPQSVWLSPRPLYRIQGTPNKVYYLTSNLFERWDGLSWSFSANQTAEESPIRLARDGELRAAEVELQLLEDFYPGFPLPEDAAAAIIPDSAPGKARVSSHEGLLFEPTAHRGISVRFARSPANPERDAEGEPILSGGMPSPPGAETVSPSGSARLKKLAEELRRANPDDEAYLQALTAYFSDGFSYSLDTGSSIEGLQGIENFLFARRSGFCLWYASAFVLLARDGGLPARLAEGYRIQTDSAGRGTVTGNHAHAWPEVFFEGEWTRFEPTPPFREENPFLRIRRRDQGAMRQISAALGADAQQESPSSSAQTGYREILKKTGKIAAAAVLAAAMGAFAYRSAQSPRRKLRRRARKLVRKAKAKGIDGPDSAGWVRWAEKAGAAFPQKKSVIDETAERMIRSTFGKPEAQR